MTPLNVVIISSLVVSVVKELISASNADVAKRLSRFFDVAMIPLLVSSFVMISLAVAEIVI